MDVPEWKGSPQELQPCCGIIQEGNRQRKLFCNEQSWFVLFLLYFLFIPQKTHPLFLFFQTLMFERWQGVKKDYQKAVELYKKAIEKGNELPMNNLG